MKYSFEGHFLVAKAETLHENAVLLSTQGALQLEVAKTPPAPTPKARKPKQKSDVSWEEKRRGLAALRDSLANIKSGETKFIPAEQVKDTDDFGSYARYYLGRALKRDHSISTQAGGWDVTVK